MNNKVYKVYKEESLWQEFCSWLGLSLSDDIDDAEDVDTLYNEFLQELKE